MNAVINKKVQFRHLGLIDYKTAWDYQESLLADIVAQKIRHRNVSAEAQQPTPNYLIFCEHPPVYTLGKSGHESNLLVTDAQLAKLGAAYYKINRGGDITYHGPGQLVGYPILDLDNFFTDIHRYMRLLEEAIIQTLAEYGLQASRIEGEGSERLTGVWLTDGLAGPRKICAMGVKASRWVTMHGFALNINTDLRYFNHIVPCGISDKAVTSMQQELGRTVPPDEVAARLLKHLVRLFDMELLEERTV